MFATTQAHDARVRRRAAVDRDALPERWKRPFQEKVTLSISREKLSLQSAKFTKIFVAHSLPARVRASRALVFGVLPK